MHWDLPPNFPKRRESAYAFIERGARYAICAYDAVAEKRAFPPLFRMMEPVTWTPAGANTPAATQLTVAELPEGTDVPMAVVPVCVAPEKVRLHDPVVWVLALPELVKTTTQVSGATGPAAAVHDVTDA